MARCGLRIVHLLEAPEAVPTLARWFVEEWGPWYGPDGRGDAEGDLAACGSRVALPICLVALSLDGAVLGTVALKHESVGCELGVGPWLAALLVGKSQRGQGIGTALVEAIERQARNIGLKAIYCSTNMAEGMLTRRGWEPFGESVSLRGRVAVYRRRLPTLGKDPS
jgi:GNAT superfamily N-acetyltransferase